MRLRGYLVFLALATLLPVAVFGAIVGYFLIKEQRETFRHGAEERTLAVVTAIDNELAISISTLNALATLPALDRDDLLTFRDRAERILATQPQWANINLALPVGQQVMNLQLGADASLPDIGDLDGSFARLRQTVKPVVSDLAVGPVLKHWSFAVRVPVLRKGALKYVLSAGVKADSINAVIKAQRLPEGWVGVVVDRNGRIVARNVDPGGTQGEMASQSLRDGLGRSASGWLRGTTIEGWEVYTPYRRSDVSGWAFAMGIPAKAVDAAAWRGAALLLASLLAAISLAVWLARVVGRRLAKPIDELAQASEAFARGKPVVLPHVPRVDELRLLEASFRSSVETTREREAALSASEERLRMALTAGRMGNWEWDIGTNKVTWSTDLETIHGLAPGTFAGTFEAYEKDVHPDDREHVRQAIGRSLEQGEHQIEYRIIRPDGATRWVEGRGKVFRDEAGAPLRVVGVCADITARKQAEENLRRAEERMRSVVDHVVDGIITIDERGTMQTFNPAAERIFGYTASEVIGRNVNHLMPDPYRSEHDGYVANYLRTGQPKVIGKGREVQGRRKDASIFPLDLAVSEFRIGSRGYFTGVVRDITERKQAEERLQRERERLDLALSAGQMGAYDLNMVNDVLWWSPETYAVFGVTPEDFVPTREAFMSLVHPEDRETFSRSRQQAITHNQMFVHEFRIVRPDGVLRWIANRARTEYDPTGQPVRHFGVAVDITERKRVEEALRAADRAKDEFLAILGHELRNPLAALTSASHVLTLADPSSDEASRARAVVERQTKHMSRLVADLLDVSRIALGKLRLQRTRINVAEAVANVMDVWKTSGRLNSHKVSLAAEPAWVDGDRARVEQIAANLLDNALKFTPAGKAVTISVRREGPDVVLEAIDEGIGLAIDECARIFDLFMQAEPSEATGAGLGIGLALVKRLAELHGGSATASSGGRGRGAVLTVRFPAAEPPTVLTETPPLRATSARSILIIDDNDDVRQMLGAMLELCGHVVRTAADGQTGLGMAAGAPPDIALIDVGLPDLDGYEVARRLRAPNSARRIGLVAVTGFGQEEDRRRAIEAGFDAHLVKPINLDRLKQIIEALR